MDTVDERKIKPEVDLEADPELERTRRRSSILKLPKPRNPLSAIEVTECIADNTITRARRVSFASSNYIKPFAADPEKNTIWDNTYEEEINHTDSKNSDSVDSISCVTKTDTNITEKAQMASMLYSQTMEFTTVSENLTGITNANCASMSQSGIEFTCNFTSSKENTPQSLMSFAKKIKAEVGLRIPLAASSENIEVKPHSKTVYSNNSMDLTNALSQDKTYVSKSSVNETKLVSNVNKTVVFDTKVGDMEFTLSSGQKQQWLCDVPNNSAIANKENCVSLPHSKTVYSNNSMDLTSADSPDKHYVSKPTINEPKVVGNDNKTVVFDTKVGDMEFTLSNGQSEQCLYGVPNNNATLPHSKTVYDDNSIEFTSVVPQVIPSVIKPALNKTELIRNTDNTMFFTNYDSKLGNMELTLNNSQNKQHLQPVKDFYNNTVANQENCISFPYSKTVCFDKSMEFTQVQPSALKPIPTGKINKIINFSYSNVKEQCLKSDLVAGTEKEQFKESNSANEVVSRCVAEEYNSMDFTEVIPSNTYVARNISRVSSSMHNDNKKIIANLENEACSENMEITCELDRSTCFKAINSKVRGIQISIDENKPIINSLEIVGLDRNLENKENSRIQAESHNVMNLEKTVSKENNLQSPGNIRRSRSPTFVPLNPETFVKEVSSQVTYTPKNDKPISRLSRSPMFVPLDASYVSRESNKVKGSKGTRLNYTKTTKYKLNATNEAETPKSDHEKKLKSDVCQDLVAENQTPHSHKKNNVSDTKPVTESSGFQNTNCAPSDIEPQQTENDSSLNKIVCTMKPSKLKTPCSSFNIEVGSSIFMDMKQTNELDISREDSRRYLGNGELEENDVPSRVIDDNAITDDVNLDMSLNVGSGNSHMLDAISPTLQSLSDTSLNPSFGISFDKKTPPKESRHNLDTVSPPLLFEASTADGHDRNEAKNAATERVNILDIESIKSHLEQYDFPEDEEELAEHMKLVETHYLLRKELATLIKNFEMPKIDGVDLREMHAAMSLTENSDASADDTTKSEVADVKEAAVIPHRVSLHDTIVEESSRSKFWNLKSVDNDDCHYYISTHFKLVTLKVVVEKEGGKVCSVEITKNERKCLENDWISQFTLNKIFLPRLEENHLLSALGPNYDLLTLLDFLNMSMEPIYKFVTNFIDLQEHHPELHLKIHPDNSIVVEILDIEIPLWWKISIKMSTLEVVDEVTAQADTFAAEISEQQIKSMAKNAPKGMDCLETFLMDMYTYYQRTKSKLLNECAVLEAFGNFKI